MLTALLRYLNVIITSCYFVFLSNKCTTHAWKWFDDRSGRWYNYNVNNNTTIDAAYRNGESRVRLVVVFIVITSRPGDEFPRRLCDPLPPMTAVLYYRWLAAGLHDKIISQGVGGHRVYVGIYHPSRPIG